VRTDELVRRLGNDEGAGGVRAVLAFLAEHPTGTAEAELNVWSLHLDAGAGTVRLVHDLDPYDVTVPAAELIRRLTALRCGPARQPPGTAPNRSRFGHGITEALLRDHVDEVARRGRIDPDEPGTITCDLGRVIGTDVEGQPSTTIRVHVRGGVVRTAYPV
jgi:hypothetical protein